MFPDPTPIADAQETVTLIASDGSSRTLEGAVRAAIECGESEGAHVVYRTSWNLPTAALSPLPVIGDTIVDSTSRRWRIIKTNLAPGGKRFVAIATATDLTEPESPAEDPVLAAIAAVWISKLPSIPLITDDSLAGAAPYAVLTDEGPTRVITTNAPTPIEHHSLRLALWDADRHRLLLTRSVVATALHRVATTTTDGRRLFVVLESGDVDDVGENHRAVLRFGGWVE